MTLILRKTLVLLLFSIIFINTTNAQKLVSYEYVNTINPAALTALLPALIQGVAPGFPISNDSVLNVINAQYDVDIYKVIYKTTHPVLGEIDASGAVAIPQGIEYECGMPMAIYQHGTTFSRTGVPSYGSLEVNFGAMLGADGYVTIMPDYMGLGDSPGMHPYVHGPTEALAAIDLMRATRELQETLDFTLNGQNFIFGYSQGGHGAMALFYELETNYANEFEATAAAPMSGPYNISDIQANVMWIDYATPSYLPYTIIGYQGVYPELKEQFPEIFNTEWAALNGFDGNSDEYFAIMDELNIPSFAYQIFTEELLNDFVLNPDHPLKVALREGGDYYDWSPKAPLLILGCCDDEQVMIENLYYTRQKMEEKGIENFEAIDWCDEYPDFAENQGFGHNGCIPFCLVKGKNFFDNLRVDCNEPTTSLGNIPVIDLAVTPNPSNGFVQIEWNEAISGKIDNVELFNVGGQLVQSALQLQQGNTLDISDLTNGIYFLEIKAGEKRHRAKLLKY